MMGKHKPTDIRKRLPVTSPNISPKLALLTGSSHIIFAFFTLTTVFPAAFSSFGVEQEALL